MAVHNVRTIHGRPLRVVFEIGCLIRSFPQLVANQAVISAGDSYGAAHFFRSKNYCPAGSNLPGFCLLSPELDQIKTHLSAFLGGCR